MILITFVYRPTVLVNFFMPCCLLPGPEPTVYALLHKNQRTVFMSYKCSFTRIFSNSFSSRRPLQCFNRPWPPVFFPARLQVYEMPFHVNLTIFSSFKMASLVHVFFHHFPFHHLRWLLICLHCYTGLFPPTYPFPMNPIQDSRQKC